MSPEDQRDAEASSLVRERIAFNKTHTAWIADQKEFSAGWQWAAYLDSMDALDAESRWQEDQVELKHITVEVLNGKCP